MRTTAVERHERHVTTDAPADVEPWASPTGLNPMRPERVLITYDLSGQCGPVVVVHGERLRRTGLYDRRITRRVRGVAALMAAPDWLRALVDEHAVARTCGRPR